MHQQAVAADADLMSHPIPGCLTSTLVPFQIIEDFL